MLPIQTAYRIPALFFSAAIILFFSLDANAQWQVDLESGAVTAGYNDVRIPGDTGTPFSLTSDLSTDPGAFFRLRLTYALSDRSTLSALAAPLRLDASGEVGRAVRLNGEEFPADVPLNARYRFDSYRLSYRYDFHRSDRFQAGVGFTAKIRAASIRLQAPGISAEKKNIGFVPLLNFNVGWMFAPNLVLTIDGDALAAPQGRAEDVLVAFRFQPEGRFQWRVGYRILEGGADVTEVYNFALLHYLVAGVRLSL
jgi:hypothetical protein